METRYSIIIDNSAGGIGAAEALREVDPDGSLAIVPDEPYPACSQPLVPKYLSRQRGLDTMLYTILPISTGKTA